MTTRDKPGKRPPGKRPDGPRPYSKRADSKQGDEKRGDAKRPTGERPDSKRPAGKRPEGKSFGKKTAPDRPVEARGGQDRPKRGVPAAAAATPAAIGAHSGAKLEPERISKLLARAGIASRRDVERMIGEGRVKMNGKVLDTPAINATLADRIEVDDVLVDGIERTRLWLYHKPAGLVTTNKDPEGRATIFDRLPADLPRVMTIGRLDINTEGLLLLTNDGGLARVLELPTTGWLRRYRVRAHGDIDQAKLDTLKEGIAVEGVLYGAIEATFDRKQGANVWITMGLREGKNREIKTVLGALGLDVNRLIRISYGPFQLADLSEGNVQEVRGRTLRDQLGARLIEESGADFDAPLINHQIAEPAAEKAPERQEAPRARLWEKAGDKRERERGRIDTKREASPKRGSDSDKRGPAGAGKPRPAGGDARRGPVGADAQKDGKRKFSTPRNRGTNVWMAPGARPLSPKKLAEEQAAAEAKAEKRARPAYGQRGDDRRDSGAKDGGRPEGKGKPSRGRPDSSGPKRGDKPGGYAAADGRKGGDGKRPDRPGGGGRPARGRTDADRRR